MVTASLLLAMALTPQKPLDLREMMRDPALRTRMTMEHLGDAIDPFAAINAVAEETKICVAYRSDDWRDAMERITVLPGSVEPASMSTFSLSVKNRPAAEVLMTVAKVWDGEWFRIGSTYVMTRRKK